MSIVSTASHASSIPGSAANTSDNRTKDSIAIDMYMMDLMIYTLMKKACIVVGGNI